MTHRTSKTVTISLPPAIVDDLDRVRETEHRTRSGLMQEALRQYVSTANRRRTRSAMPAEAAAFRLAEEEFARGDTVSLEALQNELGLPTR
jgi:predicted transcriptional regulator